MAKIDLSYRFVQFSARAMPTAKIIAFVFAVLEVGRENEIAQELREARVAEAVVVYGEYDLLCRIQTDTIEQLDSAMARLRKT